MTVQAGNVEATVETELGTKCFAADVLSASLT